MSNIISHRGGFVNTHSVRIVKPCYVHFYDENITTGLRYYKIIDISDTVNYCHENTDSATIENIEIQTDVSSLSEYCVAIGYVRNITATTGDFVCLKRWSEQKNVGNSFVEHVVYGIPGLRICDECVLTNGVVPNVSGLGSTSTCRSLLQPSGGDTSGFGVNDLLLRTEVTTGQINVSFEVTYHTE